MIHIIAGKPRDAKQYCRSGDENWIHRFCASSVVRADVYDSWRNQKSNSGEGELFLAPHCTSTRYSSEFFLIIFFPYIRSCTENFLKRQTRHKAGVIDSHSFLLVRKPCCHYAEFAPNSRFMAVCVSLFSQVFVSDTFNFP